MKLLTKAIIIAAQQHDGQTDKGGEPYILHPLRLMQSASTEEERIVAVLHDVIEDTDYTLAQLSADGFGPEIVQAIDCLSRRAEESYEAFIDRIRGNALAARVKMFDIADNMNLDRIVDPKEEDYARLEKYKRALTMLGADDPFTDGK